MRYPVPRGARVAVATFTLLHATAADPCVAALRVCGISDEDYLGEMNCMDCRIL